MPKYSVWLIRISYVYLILGFTLGALLLINKATGFYPEIWLLLPAHIEIVLYGWIMQLVMGVAYWSFPRFFRQPARGNPIGTLISIISLNIGIWIVITGKIIIVNPWLPFAGRIIETLSIIAFFAVLWLRIISPQKTHS